MYAILAASAVISSKTVGQIRYHVSKHADSKSVVEFFSDENFNLSLVVLSCVHSEIGRDHKFYDTLARITRVLGYKGCNPFTVELGMDVATPMYAEIQERIYQFVLDRYNKQFNGNFVPHHLVRTV